MDEAMLRAIGPWRYYSQSTQTICDSVRKQLRDVNGNMKGEKYINIYAIAKALIP